MTTRIQIINGEESNPAQCVEVTYVLPGGQSQQVYQLAPGEAWNQWMQSGSAVTCVEKQAEVRVAAATVGAQDPSSPTADTSTPSTPVAEAPVMQSASITASTAGPEDVQAAASAPLGLEVIAGQPIQDGSNGATGNS